MAMLKNLSALMILLVVAVALLPRGTFATDGIPDFLSHTFTPTNECCGKLLKAGKNCHNKFMELVVSSPKQIRGTISDVYRRGNEMWNNYAAAISPISPPKPAH
ncbi:hypothetical protein BT93_L5282 [Corymbia citriodora subsp. variegata]|uniref:Prolamin-like domain-containing protein n=1 Tax=Corymbia citriodora subsp. variegata TaxID=360336 RepID=A0A8T0CX05_CORYI|nr:hypothetical protein BT93_L5282 [Corymbia citriodora subsp. variegata]